MGGGKAYSERVPSFQAAHPQGCEETRESLGEGSKGFVSGLTGQGRHQFCQIFWRLREGKIGTLQGSVKCVFNVSYDRQNLQ